MTKRPAAEDDRRRYLNGCEYGVAKLDRRLDPYLGQVTLPDGKTHSGLFATEAQALRWCREYIRGRT